MVEHEPACGRPEAVRKVGDPPHRGNLCIANDIGKLPECGHCELNYLPAQERAKSMIPGYQTPSQLGPPGGGRT